MKYMLDTNICIYIIKKKPESAINMLISKDCEDVCISSITFSELVYGAEKSSYPEKNKQTLLSFLSTIKVLDYNSRAAFEYGKIRSGLEKQGTPIGSMDLLIAAHAAAEDLILVTNNEKEFRRISGLNIENWV